MTEQNKVLMDGFLVAILRVTSQFGPRVAPKPGASTDHKGIDLVIQDDVVRAFRPGLVVKVTKSDTGYGNTVRLMNNNHLDIYAHLASTSVKEGQFVEMGQKIGVQGSTGNVTGKHLHYEVRDELGKPYSPFPDLKVNRIYAFYADLDPEEKEIYLSYADVTGEGKDPATSTTVTEKPKTYSTAAEVPTDSLSEDDWQSDNAMNFCSDEPITDWPDQEEKKIPASFPEDDPEKEKKGTEEEKKDTKEDGDWWNNLVDWL